MKYVYVKDSEGFVSKKAVNKVEPDDVVIIHWSASPFINEEMITDNIRVCKEKGNAITASYFVTYCIFRQLFVNYSSPRNLLADLYSIGQTIRSTDHIISVVENAMYARKLLDLKGNTFDVNFRHFAVPFLIDRNDS